MQLDTLATNCHFISVFTSIALTADSVVEVNWQKPFSIKKTNNEFVSTNPTALGMMLLRRQI